MTLVLPWRCRCCGGRLGLQDPGDVCGTCKWIAVQP
jgi:hypothetical protein